jgi:hypothetical protein
MKEATSVFDPKNISDLLQPLHEVVGMPSEILEHLERFGATKAFFIGSGACFFLKVVDGRPVIYYSPNGQCGGAKPIDDGD